MSRFLATATLATAVRALAFDGKPARATGAVIPAPTFNFPEITQAPSLELFKRATGDQTVLIAPDNTCGYVSGRPGAFIIQEDFGRAGCCQGDNCGLRATCLDYNQVYSQSACDNGCLQDTFTLKCTETTASFCNTETFYSGIIDFYCNSYNISTPQQLYTTYSGETGAKTWQQFIITPTESGTGNTGFNSATDDGSFGLSITSKAAPSNTQTSSGGGGSGSGNNGSGGNSNNDNPPAQKQSSTPIAPIVGGVVGGVGGLALIGLAIFLIVRHNKKKNAATPGQPMQQTAGAGGMSPPPNGAAGYPPQGYNAPYGQQPYQQQTPPPQGYYPTGEQKPTGFVGLTPTGVPDRHDSTSPVSQMSDPRYSTQPHSPTTTLNSNWGPQSGHPGSPNVPPTVHEAGGNVVGERDYNSNHHGQFHEMA
ncbi:hypothetical protein F4680DRAFT_99094 [Xylaria scruposa]|nr:hypothetical protein F4680DRAFT_99094 [Xylaria scruposa]